MLGLVAGAFAIVCTMAEAAPKERFLLYRVNPQEGFNLRRDAFLRAGLLARKLGPGWKLVLPPFERMRHWKSEGLSQDGVPWSSFFDLRELRRVVPVLEWEEFRRLHPGPVAQAIHLLKTPKPEDGSFLIETTPCDGPPAAFEPAKQGWRASLFGLDEPVEVSALDCLSAFAPYSEMIGWLSRSDADTVLIDRFERLFWDASYAGAEWWEVRRGLVFAETIRERAEGCAREAFGEQPYLAIHLRRGDFLTVGRAVPTLDAAARQIERLKQRTGLQKVLLATDAAPEEVEQLRALVGFERFLPEPAEGLLDGVVAMIDQWLCVKGAHFAGTATSTFSRVIMEERLLLGHPPETTFNVLCPSGPAGSVVLDCDQPTPIAVPGPAISH